MILRMERFFYKYCFFALAFLAAVSCRTDALYDIPSDGVTVEFDNPVCGNGITKSVSEEFKLSFQEGDRISVYPQSGDEVMIYTIKPGKGSEHARASFKVEGFSLRNGTYHSVFPAVLESSDPTAIALPLTGQEQDANNSSAHLSTYDYCHASAEIYNNSGYFSFSHKVAWLKIKMPAGNRNSTFRRISVSADNGVADTLVLNVRTGAVTKDKSAADSLVLKVGGDSGLDLATGDTLTAFVCVPADTYTNLTVRTLSIDGIAYSFTFTGSYELKSGNWYQLTIGKSDVLFIGDMGDFGLYHCDAEGYVKTWLPAVKTYRRGLDQMSWCTEATRTTFEIFALGTKDCMSFRIGSGVIEEGDTYSMDILTGDGAVCEGADFKLVRKTEGSAALYDGDLGLGCIIKLDD